MNRICAVVVGACLASAAVADEVFIPIAGSVGVFRTDGRIVNPSATDTIDIDAYFLPVGNVDNTGVTPKAIEIPPRSQVVYDDIVSSLFAASGLGGVRLLSDDDLVATARVYALADPLDGTTGQFVVGLEKSKALLKGLIPQLRVTSAFRTNAGFQNPNAVAANLTAYLYDAQNALAGQKPQAIQPFGVIGPQSLEGFFGVSGKDLSNAWVAFVSDQPVFAYASVIDNVSTDATFVPALEDEGSIPSPNASTRTFDVIAHQNPWAFDIFENGVAVSEWRVDVETHVVIRVRSADVDHGFILNTWVPDMTLTQTNQIVEFDADREGTYFYACTRSTCGEGHLLMSGEFHVGDRDGDDPPPRY